MNQEKLKYISVQQIINLPPKRHLDSVNQKIFQQQQKGSQLVSNEIKQTRKALLSLVYKEVEVFSNENYIFRFPPSVFPDVRQGETNKLTFQNNFQPVQEQQIYGERLSQQQISQIRQTGQFQVPSKMEKAKIPYVWKINDCLVRGKVNIVKVWQNGIAYCFKLLHMAFQNFKTKIPKSFKQILYVPVDLFDLLLGKRSIQRFYTPDYHREVVKDFWIDIIANQLKDKNKIIGYDFLKLMQSKGKININSAVQNVSVQLLDEKRKESIRQQFLVIERNFDVHWDSIKLNIIQQSKNQAKCTNKYDQMKQLQLNQKVYNKKNKNYINYLKMSLGRNTTQIPTFIVEALIKIIVIISYIEKRLQSKQKEISKLHQQTIATIEQNYPIRGKIRQIKDQLIQEQNKILQQTYQENFFNQFANDPNIKALLNQNYIRILQKYIKFRKFYQTLIEQKKKNLKCLYRASRTFNSSYRLLHPYELRKKDDYYYLKKQQEMSTNTLYSFWKCNIYWMHLITWSLSWIVCFIYLGIYSPFGLRCICGWDQFVYDENCDSGTGHRTQSTRKTVIGVFREVLDNINNSRTQFESQPDVGLLGKSCRRFFNIVSCYIFKFLFIGVIGVLVIYPVAIILFSLLCLLLLVTFFVWVPLALIGCYLFNILIYNFQTGFSSNSFTQRLFPLLQIAFKIIWSILVIIFSFLFLFIIAPLLSVLLFIFLVLQRCLRSLFDCIMVCIISRFGKIPKQSSSLARKISGPNMSVNYYNTVAQQDLYLLIQAELQKQYVNKFGQLTRKKIQYQNVKYTNTLKYILQPFGYSPQMSSFNYAEKSKQNVLDSFNKQFTAYMRRYPYNSYNVRFREEQLQIYLHNSTELVRKYIQQNRIEGWIFQQKGISGNNYRDLTKAFWRQTFKCNDQIFEPIQNIKTKLFFQFENTSNSAILRNRMKDIMKTVDRKNITYRQQPAYENKVIVAQNPVTYHAHDPQINIMSRIIQFNDMNDLNNIGIDRNDPACLLFPPNIQFVKQYDRLAEKFAKTECKIPNVLQLEYSQ